MVGYFRETGRGGTPSRARERRPSYEPASKIQILWGGVITAAIASGLIYWGITVLATVGK